MVITFKGNGCTECPFVEIVEMALHQEICGLAYVFPNKYKLPLLVYNEKEKPDGCPFKTGTKQVKICAEDNSEYESDPTENSASSHSWSRSH